MGKNMKMIKLYKDGKASNCEVGQVALMKKAGWETSAPKADPSKKDEGGSGESSKSGGSSKSKAKPAD